MEKIFLIFFLTSISQSNACECIIYAYNNGKSHAEQKLEASFENSSVIFYGKYNGNLKFETLKLYRGKKVLPNRKLIEQTEVISNCDYFFEKNKNYLVFGKIDDNGNLLTSVCVSNAQIDNKSELKFVRKYLKKITFPRTVLN